MAAALLLNRVVSKDGVLDITVVGLIHILAFLAALARLLQVTRRSPARALLWIGALVALTDAAYVVFWNSMYLEPASCIFFLLLLAESVDIARAGEATSANVLRWSVWSALWVLAKAQNAPIGLILALFTFRLSTWTKPKRARMMAVAGGLATMLCVAYDVTAIPARVRLASAYNMVFSGVLPESK